MKNRIHELLYKAGKNQKDLAEGTGIDAATISRAVHSKGEPQGETMLAIARYFNLPVEEVFGRDSYDPPEQAQGDEGAATAAEGAP